MGFLSLLPIIQLLTNVGLTIAGQYGVIPSTAAGLASSLESALAPLFASIGNKSTTQQDVMAALGASIGILTALKNQAGVDPALVAKIDEYLNAAQAALAEGVTAAKGFDATLYAPVEPIA